MAGFDALTHDWKPLVPELIVSDLGVSLRFWRDVLGFQVLYERPAEGFAYLTRERAEVMLEVLGNSSWTVGTMERPFGRGINLQIETESLTPLLDALAKVRWPLYRAPEERWYPVGAMEAGQRQFLVQDPDGYLLRFAQSLELRPLNQLSKATESPAD
jgi:catechol 2,3-dioxygenase-like lactoylglutathione lyase family enzyme